MTEKPYTKIVTYRFFANEVGFEVTAASYDLWVVVEEIRKNGQEDTHFEGELNYIGGRWKLDDEARDHLEKYESKATADALEAYINEHGIPSAENTQLPA